MPSSTWSTAASWTLVPSPMVMTSLSPRTTLLNQTPGAVAEDDGADNDGVVGDVEVPVRPDVTIAKGIDHDCKRTPAGRLDPVLYG